MSEVLQEDRVPQETPLERLTRLGRDGGWIGVDWDGTLFTYDKWVRWNHFGDPIRLMVDRVWRWRGLGVEVRIMTARVAVDMTETQTCRVSGERFNGLAMQRAMQAHCARHGAPEDMLATCVKDWRMIELWDDRAVGVVTNTGQTLADAAVAEINALRGAP